MKGRNGRNYVLLFKLQFKHLLLLLFLFYHYHFTTLILDSNFTILVFQFLLQNFPDSYFTNFIHCIFILVS